MDNQTGDLRLLHDEQEDLRDRVRVLKGAVRRLEVMANTPCGACDEYRAQAEGLVALLADCAHGGCKGCNEYLEKHFGEQ